MTNRLRRNDTQLIGIHCDAGDSVVDTAAADGCVGLTQLPKLTESLRPHGLQWIWVKKADPDSNGPSCTGIGGGATWAGAIELPAGIGQLNGVLRLNVVEDSEEAPVPLLLPINLLEALGFDINLKKMV